MINELKRKKKDYFIITIMLIVYALVMQITGVGCPIKFLTGISCPGCGITRACFSAVQFDFNTAMKYHPLFWLIVPSFIMIIVKDRNAFKEKNWFRLYIYVVVAVDLIVYLFRLIRGNSLIVVCDISNGFIYKILKTIIDLL